MTDNEFKEKLIRIMDKRIALIIDCYQKQILDSRILDVVEVNENLDECLGSSFIDAGMDCGLDCDEILRSRDHNDQHFAKICAQEIRAREEIILENHISENAQTKQCNTDDINKIIDYALAEHNITNDQTCLVYYPRNLYGQLDKKFRDNDKIKTRSLCTSSTQVIFVGYKSIKWTRNSGCILASLSSDYKSIMDKYHQYIYLMEPKSKIDFRIRSQNEYGIIHPENICVYNLLESNNKTVETICE